MSDRLAVGLADTSVFIATEAGRLLGELPEAVAVSVVTIGELRLGVLVADCRAAGVDRSVKLTDALIAATVIERGLPVVTQDVDFDQIARAHPALTVVRV